MNRTDARQVVDRFVEALPDRDVLVVDERSVEETDAGWVFHLVVEPAVVGGQRPPGAQPVFVDARGELHLLATAWSVEEQLAALRAGTDLVETDVRDEVALLLTSHRALVERLDRLSEDDRTLAHRAIAGIEDRYRELLPDIAVSRCPVTQEVLWLPIDVDGLDGLWWRADDPVRRDAHVPPTVIAVTGGVAVVADDAADVAEPAFRVAPGPSGPAVAPELLAHDGVTAVVSCVPIGPHLGFPVVYFARPEDQAGLPGASEWGRDPDAGEPVRDRELRPWIEAGKVLWIAPFDEDLALRSGTDGCPYLDDAS
jgi:hypothetical protein